MARRELILFVEGEETARRSRSKDLRAAGFLVQEAQDPEEGFRLFSPDRHGMLIASSMGSTRRGRDLIQHVKEEAPHLPVLAVIDGGRGEGAREADEILDRSCSTGQLLDTVGRLLGCREAEPTEGAGPHYDSC